MKKFIALFLAVTGFAALPVTPASAHETVVPASIHTTVSSLPSTVRINETVVVTGRHHHRRYRVERRRVRRHGHWVTVTRRIHY